MFERKAKACKFANVGGHYHASGGALGQYRISKVKGQRGYRVHWTGGAVRKSGSTWVPTLAEGKKLVAFRLGCRWPTKRK